MGRKEFSGRLGPDMIPFRSRSVAIRVRFRSLSKEVRPIHRQGNQIFLMILTSPSDIQVPLPLLHFIDFNPE